MTDAAIADTINRRTAHLVADRLDRLDQDDLPPGWPYSVGWPYSAMADTMMGANDSTDADRAWLIGMMAARTPGVGFDGHPADADWENLFFHFRAEITARRDPQTPPARAAIAGLNGVGSR